MPRALGAIHLLLHMSFQAVNTTVDVHIFSLLEMITMRCMLYGVLAFIEHGTGTTPLVVSWLL
jgi:hypothetical protein